MGAALAAKTDYPDRYPVPYIEKKPMSDPAPKPDESIPNLQKDVTDLRAEVRAMNGRIDAVRVSVDTLRDRMDQHRSEDRAALDARFDKVDDRFDKVDDRFEKVDTCLMEMRKETKSDFKALTDRIDKVIIWAVGLLMALGSLIAHGFKWF